MLCLIVEKVGSHHGYLASPLYRYDYIVYSDNNENDLAAIARMDARYGDKWREKKRENNPLQAGSCPCPPQGWQRERRITVL